MTASENPIPQKIILHKRSRILELVYSATERYQLPCEFLRVFSPSADMKTQRVSAAVAGKVQVTILAIEPVGQYAIKPIFSDGHATGIFSWSTLYRLATRQTELWEEFLQQAGKG